MIGEHYTERPVGRHRRPLLLAEALEGARAQAVRENRQEAVAWYRVLVRRVRGRV